MFMETMGNHAMANVFHQLRRVAAGTPA
ncbi:hypothetical protein L195_g038735, partial [Trifolium pratense]